MAKKQGQNSAQLITNTFVKGLNKDSDPSFVSEGMWTHARNAVNNTDEGNIGTLSNETSNFLCATAGATMPTTGQFAVANKYIIGGIQLFSDKWIIFTAGHNSFGQPVLSEVGLLEEQRCIYRPIVQDPCLGFDKRYLISGVSREKEDCSWQVYWADGLNPDRYLNVGDPQLWPSPSQFPVFGTYGTSLQNTYTSTTGQEIQWPGVQWEQKCTPATPCEFCVDDNKLNCSDTRLARLVETPCLNLQLGPLGGTLANGTYFATIAYAIKGQRVTDYFSPSNTQPIWSPLDLQGALSLEVNADTVNFDEFILVIVFNVNQQTVAKQIGIYSTQTTRIELDRIKEDLITVPIEQIPIQTPVYETSDQMSEANNYLLRVGPRTKFDFNYQPLANLIRSKWVSVEYPADYYVKGGNKGSYYRDEVYSFFIRWIYDTGDKSSSYHIPGRPPQFYNYVNPQGGTSLEYETDSGIFDQNKLEGTEELFETYNTATVLGLPAALNTTLPDGGKVIGFGDMGYWESTEIYPNNQSEIWNSSEHCWTGPKGQDKYLSGPNLGQYINDLCGKQIRHHKFPDNGTDTGPNSVTLHYKPNVANNSNELNIRILGVVFENILLPVDNEGKLIEGIVGYEILRGSREGNRTILAKGMINNFRTFENKSYPLNQAGSIVRGLYANYPFNSIRPVQAAPLATPYSDPYIKSDIAQQVPLDITSIHSPDLMFSTPFLSATELKIYGELRGYSQQQFKYPQDHPEFKLLSDLIVTVAFIAGAAQAVISMVGKRTMNQPNIQGVLQQLAGGNTNPTQIGIPPAGLGTGSATQIAIEDYNDYLRNYYGGTLPILDALQIINPFGGYSATSVNQRLNILTNVVNNNATSSGIIPMSITGTIEFPDSAYLPSVLSQLGALNRLSFYFSEGADLAIRAFYTFIPYQQYALQCIGHGLYDRWGTFNRTQIQRFKLQDSFYIRDNIQQVPSYQLNTTGQYVRYTINNLQRGDTVTLRTLTGPYYNPIAYPNGASTGPYEITAFRDNSLITLSAFDGNTDIASNGTLNPITNYPTWENPSSPFSTQIASHYAGLKYRIRNLYGQLDSIKQIPITPCEQKLSDYTINTGFYTSCPSDPGTSYSVNQIYRTPIFFGGDIFINRYTEKNSMLFFYNWLYDQPDGFEYNYKLYNMIPDARFWVNSKKYDVQDLIPNNFGPSMQPGTGAFPTKFYKLDNKNYEFSNDSVGNYPGVFRVNDSYFYVANSGVRDFFVESEVLVDFRTDGELEFEKHYNPYRYTDLVSMFDTDPQIITRGNIWRYDYSLSITKLFNQYFSSGNLQNRYYNPKIAKLCYTYYPDRIVYSLPQQEESSKDSWFVFLVNNYKEFKSQISAVKPINKSGIIITFKNDSPLMYQGVDTLQTELGTKVTIGDGGLFSQPPQAVSNSDRPYEYGSSQNRLSVIGTPAGIYYISQNQGKIFLYGGGLKEISQAGLKWWFSEFLPYKLTEDFPDYPYQDNPVAGIGCQSVYDNENSIVYFSKKDYKLKQEFVGQDVIQYVPLILSGKNKGKGDYFTNLNFPGSVYLLGDEAIFENASWTISFDPKNQFFLSYHDWCPDLTFPTKNTFLTTKVDGIWKHNSGCTSYCNFYGTNYPFEIELPIITGQTVTTLKSVEYILESYRKEPNNCVDQFHVLDFNFDRAVIYNSEQVSGYLNLNIFPKNNVTLSEQYPKLNQSNLASFDILFSKEENKYRFNQFWDITRDRSEFPIGSDYPPTGPVIPGTTVLQGNYADRFIWITQPNGYIKDLNPANLDFQKPETQRKKFRHYLNFIRFIKDISTDTNMIVKITNTKNQISPR
jgi:hypothetical protein